MSHAFDLSICEACRLVPVSIIGRIKTGHVGGYCKLCAFRYVVQVVRRVGRDHA